MTSNEVTRPHRRHFLCGLASQVLPVRERMASRSVPTFVVSVMSSKKNQGYKALYENPKPNLTTGGNQQTNVFNQEI